MLLPRPDVYFFPFSEGAALFRQETRQVTVLNQNAAVIWCLLNEGNTIEEAADALNKKSQIGKTRANNDVKEATKFFLDKALLSDGLIAEGKGGIPEERFVPALSPGVEDVPIIPHAYQKVFKLPGVILEICCTDKEIVSMLDEVLAQMAITTDIDAETRLLVVPAENDPNCWNVFSDAKLIFTDIRKESVLPHLLQLMFEMSCRALDKYLLFHAAAIGKNSKVILFPAHAGCGKTTLAAMLAGKGFQFFSDELAVVDVESLQVRTFAMPMSIKRGSLSVLTPEYPELENLTDHLRPDGKVVRYLQPPNENFSAAKETAPVSAIVFPKYQRGGRNKLISLAKEEALLHLAQTCSSDRLLRPEDIRAMLSLVEQSRCMALHYEDINEAISLFREQIL